MSGPPGQANPPDLGSFLESVIGEALSPQPAPRSDVRLELDAETQGGEPQLGYPITPWGAPGDRRPGAASIDPAETIDVPSRVGGEPGTAGGAGVPPRGASEAERALVDRVTRAGGPARHPEPHIAPSPRAGAPTPAGGGVPIAEPDGEADSRETPAARPTGVTSARAEAEDDTRHPTDAPADRVPNGVAAAPADWPSNEPTAGHARSAPPAGRRTRTTSDAAPSPPLHEPGADRGAIEPAAAGIQPTTRAEPPVRTTTDAAPSLPALATSGPLHDELPVSAASEPGRELVRRALLAHTPPSRAPEPAIIESGPTIGLVEVIVERGLPRRTAPAPPASPAWASKNYLRRL
jgi:hypothetical protein